MQEFRRKTKGTVRAAQFFKAQEPYPYGVAVNALGQAYVQMEGGRAFVSEGEWVVILEDGQCVVLPDRAFHSYFEAVEVPLKRGKRR